MKSGIEDILKQVSDGAVDVQQALAALKHLPYQDIGVARVDHHRALRHGIPEVLFAEGKERADIRSIAQSMLKESGRLLVTRASAEIASDVGSVCEDMGMDYRYYERSGMIASGGSRQAEGLIAVLCAGTSDMSVAEEADVTAAFLGSRVERVNDVGVAGLHRITESQGLLSEANVIVVAAGMEGALPSVVGGMTDRPLIAVPVSTGYGTSLGGITALFAMLNSCVPGIAVMNIDNGFGAGVMAHKINMLASKNIAGQ